MSPPAVARRVATARLWTLALWALASGAAAVELVLLGILLLAGWRARLTTPPPSFLAVDRTGAFLGEIGAAGGASDDELGYWPLDRVPPRVAAAAIALEDRRFAWHPGVDPLAIARALGQNGSHARRVSGASTLAMQVARMQSPGERGYLRKLVEATTAWLLTARYGREAVLRQYLTLVPYGNRIHGIAYAARRYLAKPVADLSWAEIAFLSALPQAPGRMSPYDPQGRVRALRRGERLLDRLAAQGLLSPAELDLAQREIRGLQVPYLERRPPEALHALLELERRVASSGTPPGGTPPGVVRSTLDLDLQRAAAWETHQALRAWESRGAGNAALLVVDAKRREILAWVGSADYADATRAGAIDYVRVARSPGSTLKPFLYALALEQGAITPATVLDDLGRGPGGIANADDRFLGPLLPRVALGNSRNVPAVAVLQRLGVGAGLGFLRELGLDHAAASPDRYGLGLAIGGLPVTLADLARAYTVLSGDGTLADLRLLRDAAPEPAERLLSEDTAREITLFLADPQARLPSFPRLGASEYPFPVAVKTGTSSNFRDAWTVAYSAKYLVAAWVGHPGNRPMNRLTGYRSAAELAQRVLLHLHRDDLDGLHDLGFPPPRDAQPVRLCALTGKRATAACDRTILEWLRPGAAPAEDCPAHRRREVDRRDGRLATAATPATFRETRTFLDLEPRYAEWLASQRLPVAPLAASPLGEASAARGLAGAAAPRLRITSPEDGVRLVRDPELPEPLATLALRAVVDPPSAQVVWYVDGMPYEVSDRPYTARWPLRPGAHRFQARLPFQGAVSREVSVRVE